MKRKIYITEQEMKELLQGPVQKHLLQKLKRQPVKAWKALFEVATVQLTYKSKN
jgi:hypothetical protein